MEDSEIQNLTNVQAVKADRDVEAVKDLFKKTTADQELQKKLDSHLENINERLSEHALYSNEIKNEKFRQELIKKIAASKLWKDSEEIVNAIKFSAGYIAEIILNNKKGTLESAQFEIRHTGAQHRHITPVVTVEKIILDSLRTGASISDILTSLQYKIEVFKPSVTEDDSDYIQKIFVYFKNPEYANSNGIAILIKILAYLYNENILLAMSDEFVKIPYKPNERCLIPIITSKQKHGQEGVLSNAR